MKFKFLLSASLLATAFTTQAQQSNRGFAITGDGNNDFTWMNIREVDLTTGKVTGTLFDRVKSTYKITDVLTKKSFNQTTINDGTAVSASMYPTSSFVAAAAFDNRSSKLFFVPMRMGQIRWMDVNEKSATPTFYTIEIPGYVPSNYNEEANNITRMVIGADGFGYAITNDGNHLYKFTTGKKPTITDLGSLIDADSNSGLSVHNKCSSWGGDMIADAYGKLYVISATKNVFEINVDSKITTYKGAIQGLPANFTANGAAVTANGDVVLSSAVAFVGYYKMNMADLKATLVEGSDVKYNASDLASSNLLFQKEADAARTALLKPMVYNDVNAVSNVYPNPITSNTFNVLLSGKVQGKLTVIITDLAGRVLQTSNLSVAKSQQQAQINLTNKPSKGTYLVKVLDENKVEITSDKVVIL
jgi:Secretion system C-terminal sorting domain